MPDLTTDEDLVATAAAGDPAALEALFDRYHRDLFRFLRRVAEPADAAEDLVQEVFLRVWKSARSFRPDGSFRGWLYRIARNAAADEFRKSSRLAPVGVAVSPEDLPAPERVPGELAAALARLAAADREVLVLARFHGLSGAELAAALECSTGAARVRLHRALKRLRALYLETQEEHRHAMRRVE
ncbi:MAG TPA: RNA polymerase sigma factor [Thermoanaerobaculia bacterium]